MSEGELRSQDQGQPLDYQQRPRLAWISRHRRLLIFLTLCLAGALSIWWYWPALTHRVLWLYWSHRAAEHVMPPASAISIIGPEAASIPTTNPDYVPYSPFKPNASTQPSASYYPLAFRQLVRFDGRLQSLGYASPGPVIFMGTVHRPDGKPRLVIISGGQELDSRYMLISIGVAVLSLPGWFDPLPPVTGPAFPRGGRGQGRPPEPAAYLTGALDPKDLTHIIIPYTISESDTAAARAASIARGAVYSGPSFDLPHQIIGRGEIDVHLQNDDSLVFGLRGPGQTTITKINADPASLEQAAQAFEAQRLSRGRGRSTSPTTSVRTGVMTARSRGRGPSTSPTTSTGRSARSRGSPRGN